MSVTNGRRWREAREVGIEFTFPSGNVAAIRPIEVDFFLRVGNVPNPLVTTIADVVDGKAFDPKIVPSQLLDNKKEWITFLNELTRYALVAPKVVENPAQDDEVSIDDISYADKLFLWALFTRPANLLRAFRETQAKSLATLDIAANDGRTSEQGAAD